MERPTDLVLPDRIERLRNELFAAQDSVCFERARIVTESYQDADGEHPCLRRAKALYAVFSRIPIFIREGELLVGQRASRLGARSVYPEFHLHGLSAENTPPEIWEYWHGRTLGDVVRAQHPPELRAAERELAAGYCTGTDSGFGHVIADYEKVLRVGFRGIIQEARASLDAAPPDDVDGRAFLESVIIAADAITTWANRYADLADNQAARHPDPERRDELLDMAEVCRRVPAEPARTFHEALQSFWFTHLALHIEQYGWSISAGRFDQYMLPYYHGDLGSRCPTPDGAWELLLSLWVKFMENVGTQLRASTFQNLTLGGRDAQGRDQSNELSWLCLDATLATQFIQPALSVRWHPRIAPEFWGKVHSTILQGLGMPALFNDEVIIPALTSHGVAPADAVDYGIVGCVESAVPGKQQGLTAGGHINVAKALELALNDGRSMLTGEPIGPGTGDPADFTSFDEVLDAYATQVRYLAEFNIAATHLAGEGQKRRAHCPLLSSILDDCLERRQDLVDGGTRYNLSGIAIYGPSNVYDGLAAIRKFVFEEERVTLCKLREALLADLEGHEELRQLLARGAPRFGNDQLEVDELANRVNAVHADYCWAQRDPRGGRYTCGVWPVEAQVHAGRWTAATPDGRQSGTPIVDGVGACQGADRNGPTAVLNSVSRLNAIDHWPAGYVCNIKLSRGRGNDEERRKLQDLTTTFLEMGGQEVQINVVDADTLRNAQERPELHPDLIVRVAGFSAYFTTLSREVQDEIISRTEHPL